MRLPDFNGSRPFDVTCTLSYLEARSEALVMELNGETILVIRGVTSRDLVTANGDLLFEEFDQLTCDQPAIKGVAATSSAFRLGTLLFRFPDKKLRTATSYAPQTTLVRSVDASPHLDQATAVQSWFSRARVASLNLPWGWFGAPHAGRHKLTYTAARRNKLLLELDNDHLLIFSNIESVMVDERGDLVLTNFRKFTFDYHEPGSVTPEMDFCVEGECRFGALR